MSLTCWLFGHHLSWPKASVGVVTYECLRCFQTIEGAVLWDLDAPRKVFKAADRAKVEIPRVLPAPYRFGRKRA